MTMSAWLDVSNLWRRVEDRVWLLPPEPVSEFLPTIE